jgi:hypothetical protein
VRLALDVLGIAFAVFVIWALFYGFTIDGKHHQIRLTEDSGVEVR